MILPCGGPKSKLYEGDFTSLSNEGGDSSESQTSKKLKAEHTQVHVQPPLLDLPILPY